jgi:UDP-GlcNAc:undecaprenyl-phosphate/decaprenyl-phosphate GlcNAc-1-phosphate transferase
MIKKKLKNLLPVIFDAESRKIVFSRVSFLLTLSLVLTGFQFLYLAARYQYLTAQVPLWFTQPWGLTQLGDRSFVIAVPLTSLAILLTGTLFLIFSKRYFVRFFDEIVALSATFAISVLTYSLVRIVVTSSGSLPLAIDPVYMHLVAPFLVSFLMTLAVTPWFIRVFKDKGIVTNPGVHSHPAMILTKPSVRGGGLVFAVVFLVTSALFIPPSAAVTGIFLCVALLSLLGLADDYQNTHPESRFKFLEIPWLRLIFLFCTVSIITAFGIQIDFIGNPFGGVLSFTGYALVPAVITVIWVVWILNLLSWSNGIDGQYSGIIGVASLVIALLALRFNPLLPEHMSYARMAVIVAGCSLALIRYTWHPSKIMWGFSAITAGLVLASLSILVSTKVATSVIIILIPFLDAVVTVVRRLIQKKNPLKGDKGHLHHLLMERGWSVRKIALFYWTTTALFGLIGLVASEKYIVLVTLMMSVIVASFIVLVNLRSLTKRSLLRSIE